MRIPRSVATIGIGIVGVTCAGVLISARLDQTPSALPLPSEAPSIPAASLARTVDIRVEVEQAYLREWDRFAQAALARDPLGLSEVLAGDALRQITAQIRALDRPMLIRVDHSYTIALYDRHTAFVDDRYQNHSVAVDPATMRPLGPDPDRVVHAGFTLRRVNGTWKVTDIISF